MKRIKSRKMKMIARFSVKMFLESHVCTDFLFAEKSIARHMCSIMKKRKVAYSVTKDEQGHIQILVGRFAVPNEVKGERR